MVRRTPFTKVSVRAQRPPPKRALAAGPDRRATPVAWPMPEGAAAPCSALVRQKERFQRVSGGLRRLKVCKLRKMRKMKAPAAG